MSKMILDMKHIEKEFGHNRVLKGVDLQIHEGEVISLVGENGAGKSTLMNNWYGTSGIHASPILHSYRKCKTEP